MKTIASTRLAAAVTCSILSAAAFAQSNPSPDSTASTAVTVQLNATSDIRNRGISDSLRSPGMKLSIQAAHESGVIGLLELNNVSKKQFLDGRGLAVVAGVGYRFGDPDAWHFGIGAAGEWFPGAKFDAPHAVDFEALEPLNVKRTRYDNQFVLLEAGYGDLEARVMSVISKSYRGADTGGVCGQLLSVALQVGGDLNAAAACFARGDHDSRGTLLFDVNYRYALSPQSALTLHAGHQQVRHFKEVDTSDFAVGLAHKRWGYTFSAEWLKVNARNRDIYLVPDGNRLRASDNSTLVLTVSRAL